MPTVLILMDAFRHDYLSEEVTPFLFHCSRQGEHYKTVLPSPGYCERTEVLTGLRPRQSGFLTAIGYDPDRSPFSGMKWLRIFEWIERGILSSSRLFGKSFSQRLYRYYKIRMKRFLRRRSSGMSPYEIPVSLLPYWSLTEDRIDHREDRAFPTASILSLVDKKGGTYFYDSFTALNLPANGADQDRLHMALAEIRNRPHDLTLIYVAAPDHFGHKYGPQSDELKRALRQMDQDLKDFTETFQQHIPGSNFVFLGDHGMATVTQSFDAGEHLNQLAGSLGLKLKRDYIYFLDSTLMRVWFLSDRAKRDFAAAIQASQPFRERGVFVDEALAEKHHIPWPDSRYGDLLWWTHPGVLIFPDFFHKTDRNRGMHGYDPDLPESQGMCIVYGDGIQPQTVDSIPLTETFSILKRLVSA